MQHYLLPTAAKSSCWNESCVLLDAVVVTDSVSVFVPVFDTASTGLVSSSAEADGLTAAVVDDGLVSTGVVVVVFASVLDTASSGFVSS